MRKFITTLFLLVYVFTAYTQVPEKVNYQAVLRDASGNIIDNTKVSLSISILQGTTTGSEVFSENHSVTTNDYGLINIEIGSVNDTDFVAIDWSNGPFYMEISIDGTSLGTTQILSVPYALYSAYAEYAETADFNNLLNVPDFSGWDQDVTDDFDGQYSSLTDAPEVFWTQNDSNLYYTSGSVGINITDPSNFGGAALFVGGGIRYEGIPNDTTPGLLFYDNTGDGSFKYYDNTGTEVTLGTGDITYTGSYVANESGDIIKPNDYIIDGSMEIGFDAVSGYDFGFNTLVFAENNLRILFDDTDTLPGYPNNDWQIEINETANGGTNHYAINDITSATNPFKIMAGAPDNSIYIDSDGNVGIGTDSPTNKLSVNGSIRALSFIGDGSGITGITGATGGIANTEDIIISADTNSNGSGEIALQTQNITRMLITNDGKIGIGTSIPTTDLEVEGTGKFQNLEVDNMLTLKGISYTLNIDNTAGPATLDYDVADKNLISFNPFGGAIEIDGFSSGEEGQEITIINNGSQNITINHDGSGNQKIYIPGGSDIILSQYSVATFICDGTVWYCISLNN